MKPARVLRSREMFDPEPERTEGFVGEMTYAEYLAFEELAEVKHEYIRGRVYAMAGGTIDHGLLASNFTVALATALRERPCVVLGSDVRTRIVAADRATYPDIVVVCGKIERAVDDEQGVANPLVIVEVLSKSTEASDRGEKFLDYRELKSLREYVLVAQGRPRVEVFRLEGGLWTMREWKLGEVLELASLGITVPVDEIYRNPLAAGDA